MNYNCFPWFTDEETVSVLESNGYEVKIEKYDYIEYDHNIESRLSTEVAFVYKDKKRVEYSTYHRYVGKYEIVENVFKKILKSKILNLLSNGSVS